MEACFALSWVATDDQMKEVVKKVHDNTKTDPKASFIRQCYLETLIHRPGARRDGGARRPAHAERAGHRGAPPGGARHRHGRHHARRWSRRSSPS